MFSNGITVSIGEATEEQIEAKSAVPWLQHSTYDYDNQPSMSFSGNSNTFNGNQINGIEEPMEVDDSEDNLGLSLDLMFKVSKNIDIGQVRIYVCSLS